MAAVAAQPIPFVDIDGRRFAAFPNPSLTNKDGTPKSALDHVISFGRETNGAFRELQLFERICKATSLILKQLGSSMAIFFENLAGGMALSWAMLTIPRLPEVTKTAKKAISEWMHPTVTPLNTRRDDLQKIHDVADAAASWAYAGSLVTGSTLLKNIADVPNLVADYTDMQMAAQDWGMAKKYIEVIRRQNPDNIPVQQRFVDTMRYSLIKLIKAVSSVVSGVLGLMVRALGGPLLPAIALVALALISTNSAISAHFYKETRPYPLVDFFQIRQPEILVLGIPAQ